MIKSIIASVTELFRFTRISFQNPTPAYENSLLIVSPIEDICFTSVWKRNIMWDVKIFSCFSFHLTHPLKYKKVLSIYIVVLIQIPILNNVDNSIAVYISNIIPHHLICFSIHLWHWTSPVHYFHISVIWKVHENVSPFSILCEYCSHWKVMEWSCHLSVQLLRRMIFRSSS